MSAPTDRLGLVLAALLAGGCGYAHQCAIPDAPLGPPPGPPLPATVGVAYPADLATRSVERGTAQSTWRFPVGPAAVSAFNRAAVQLFASPVAVGEPAPGEGGPAAVLAFTLDDAKLRPGPLRPEAAEVTVTAVLRDGRGEVARASATARAEAREVHGLGILHCDAAGPAVGGALAAAASRVRDELGASPAVAAWVRDQAGTPAPTAGAEAPLPAPAQPPASERRHRLAVVPRYLELDAVQGTAWSSAPGLARVAGAGWGLRLGWDVGEYVALGLHAAASHVRVDWTPNPAEPSDDAENGFVGAELLVRLRPGQQVRPWFGVTGAYQGVSWSSYLYSVAGWSLVGSAGLDVAVGPWGAVRLGLSGSTFTATTSSSVSAAGTTPGPGDDGWSTGLRSLWVTAGWLFDLGPAR